MWTDSRTFPWAMSSAQRPPPRRTSRFCVKPTRQLSKNSAGLPVDIHDLLGQDGTANFDLKQPPTKPVTKAPVESWYKQGDTYSSGVGGIGASYEGGDRKALGVEFMARRFLACGSEHAIGQETVVEARLAEEMFCSTRTLDR